MYYVILYYIYYVILYYIIYIYFKKSQNVCFVYLFLVGEGKEDEVKKMFGVCFKAFSQRMVIRSLYIIMDAQCSGFHDGLNSR